MIYSYPLLHDTDIKDNTRAILEKVRGYARNENSVLEIGSGVGRVTPTLLSYYDKVVMVEASKHFLDEARENFTF